ncbi:MAG TPA: hypothetical protein VND87_01625 [Stellaceae bacterium]|nr:hypothetical protein [Stellaceae bacterium]
MKRLALAAALGAMALQQPAVAAVRGACYTSAAMEADQAIRYMTDLMVVSTACQDQVYVKFRLRNQDAIRDYQHTMISHFHGTARFDNWDTQLANELALKRNVLPTPQMCQQAAGMLARAGTLDTAGFRAFAAAMAAKATSMYHKCGR